MFVYTLHRFASSGQPCQGAHQDLQIRDGNHIFVLSLARFKFFVAGLARFQCL